jgi:hypothetical protein
MSGEQDGEFTSPSREMAYCGNSLRTATVLSRAVWAVAPSYCNHKFPWLILLTEPSFSNSDTHIILQRSEMLNLVVQTACGILVQYA